MSVLPVTTSGLLLLKYFGVLKKKLKLTNVQRLRRNWENGPQQGNTNQKAN